ncbi:MAG: helix-turn-helix domain-containing protein [Hoeflea sp.]|uniref:AraC family transcriptional regulator n=1 Tax=Hoeflea sp. TaxID=1940281 RepID=UPI001D5A3081|nr:helix-turn-helix domain-containing protein [Hoeflea sp.]MBU4528432.1 helix-turn-helix domain-containing protein [Alphaproteobacteria bacterium]MBU4543101.1 helix-turn-helix domain-containing protein [Alphaproteobacteria bacterium]MBU4551792.1 helix-turn-helix domain-containing protein [Alphaproteobacteria bacterium]MBV1723687.1 helix-turn-helix domain-containing protein [Hoeflea sp.]MBV1762003.1 helix-turn-helix domain-containing protein [Hoeflea sp.]
MKTNPDFQKWHHVADASETSIVFPDGCRDVLVISENGRPDRVVLTEFDFHPRSVTLRPGTQISGYRLRPGAMVDQRALSANTNSADGTEDMIGNALVAPDELDYAILSLTFPGSTVLSVSRSLGVSARTLQRRFRDQDLPPPDFWRLLGRARLAAAQLASAAPLAEVACDGGYSDQAHMTREFLRWFHMTPTQIRRNAGLLEQLGQPALGNWTGEQISIR